MPVDADQLGACSVGREALVTYLSTDNNESKIGMLLV